MPDHIGDLSEYDQVDFGVSEVEYITQSVATTLTLSDYRDLGFGNITDTAVQAMNVRLASEIKPAVISHATLKPIVDDVLAHEAAFQSMIRHESAVTDPSVYTDAGLVGVNANNIDRINKLLLNDPRGAALRLSEIQELIDHQNHQFEALFDFVNAISADTDNYQKALADGTFVENNMTASSPLVDGFVFAKSWWGPGWDAHYEIFDGTESGAGNGYASDYNVDTVYAGEPEGIIGIYDIYQLIGPRVLDSVSINLRTTGEITTGFWIQVYNATWQRWENIHYSDAHSTNAGTQTIDVDSDKAYSGFRLYLQAPDDGITVINELWFNTKGADLFDEAGIQGINAYNAAFISAALVTAQAGDATLFNSNTAVQQAVDSARREFLVSEISRVTNDASQSLGEDFYAELGFEDFGEASRLYLDAQWRDEATSSDLNDIEAMTAFVSQQVLQPSALMNLLSEQAEFGADRSLGMALTTVGNLREYVPRLSGDVSGVIENNPYRAASYPAWRLFDDSGATYFADDGNLTSSNPLLLGYQGDVTRWTRIQSFSYEYREESGSTDRTPRDFTLQGLDPLTGSWVDIQTYFNTSSGSDKTFSVDSDVARQAFVGYRLNITSANSSDSNSKVNLDELQFNVYDVVVDSSLFTALELPMVTAETSGDILLALLEHPTLDLTDHTAVLAEARAQAISLGIEQYALKAGANVEAPTAAELVEAGFTDVNGANLFSVLEALVSSQADGLSVTDAVAAGVQTQINAFMDLTQNYDGAGQIFAGKGALFVPSNGTSGSLSATSQWNTTDHKIANAFDRNTATFWGNNLALSEANPEQVSWVSNDPNYRGIVRQIELDVRDAFPSRLPAAFDLEGWNGTTGQWEFIQSFTDNTLSSIERFAVASNKAYSGFRLSISASQKTDNTDNSTINLDEIRFVVEPIVGATDFDYISTDATLLTYRQAGIDGVMINNIDRINAAVRAEINGGTTLNAAQLDVIVEQQSLIQSVVDADPSVEADQQRMSLLTAAVDDLQALKTFASVSDYEAQKGSGTELTLAELSAISGRSLSNDDLDQFIQDFIHTDSKITSRLLVNELIDTDAHLSSVNFVDEFGSATSYSGPDKISELPERLEVGVALDFDIQVGDTVELIIDGVVVSQSSLSQAEIDAKQVEFAVNSAGLAPASLSDEALDLVVRTTDLANGQVEETQIWQFDWQ